MLINFMGNRLSILYSDVGIAQRPGLPQAKLFLLLGPLADGTPETLSAYFCLEFDENLKGRRTSKIQKYSAQKRETLATQARWR